MDKMRERIKGYIIDNFLFGDEEGLEDQTSFLDAGIVDSTGILELVDFLDNEFRIKISDDEILPENLDSINNIINFLDKKSVVSKVS
jgi:acyl carrier protein